MLECPHRHRSDYNEKQHRPTSRWHRERQPEDQTMDATGKAGRETQFRGWSQASLYNEVHRRKNLGYRSPSEFIEAHARP
jgi:hypothetical protein